MKKLFFLTAIVSLLFVGCNNDSEPYVLQTTSLSVRTGQSAQIVVTPNTDGVTFEVPMFEWLYPIKLGTISETGLYTALRFPSAFFSSEHEIIVKRNGEVIGVCIVSHLESYALRFRRPIISWSAFRWDVEDFERRGLFSETATGLGFMGENNHVISVLYLFTGARLSSVGIEVPNSEISHMRGHLRERTLSFGDDLFLWYDFLENISGAIQHYAPRNSWLVMFFPTPQDIQAVSDDLIRNKKTEVAIKQLMTEIQVTEIQEKIEKMFAMLDTTLE